MRGKLASYSLISILSFCFFTVIFHTVASAQTADSPLFGTITPPPLSPTPTIYALPTEVPKANTIAFIPTTPTPTPSSNTTQSETKANTSDANNKQTPTTTPMPTDTPTPTALPTETPTPTQVPQPTIAVITDLESLFAKYSDDYHVDKELLKKIARCESNFNTTSNNSGLYLGMFQFAASSWMGARNAMGADPNPDLRTNAEESIRTAAYMISMGRQSAWPNCH